MSYSMRKELKPASFIFALSESSPVFFYLLKMLWSEDNTDHWVCPLTQHNDPCISQTYCHDNSCTVSMPQLYWSHLLIAKGTKQEMVNLYIFVAIFFPSMVGLQWHSPPPALIQASVAFSAQNLSGKTQNKCSKQKATDSSESQCH
ncbi:hypothetical protein E2320_017141 [Naja naja]|nr:hypothetical protein E2320_017141 [Naja naja]